MFILACHPRIHLISELSRILVKRIVAWRGGLCCRGVRIIPGLLKGTLNTVAVPALKNPKEVEGAGVLT